MADLHPLKRANRSAGTRKQGAKRPLLLALCIGLSMLLVPSIFAENSPSGFEIVGNTVRWENSKGSLVVWPHTSTGLIHTQYANLTAYADGTYDFAFEFENPVKGGRFYLWQNMSHNIRIDGIGNITNSMVCPGDYNVNWGAINDTWMWCDYGNGTYWEHYYEWENHNSQGVKIFWNTTGTITHYEEEYYFDWKDRTSLLTHSTYNNKHFYWIKDVNMNENGLKQSKWTYQTAPNTEGKWQLWIKKSSDTIDDVLLSENYVKLDPWWNSSYANKRAIYGGTESGTYTGPVLINDSDMEIFTTPQYVWCNFSVNTTWGIIGYLYYNDETDYICVNSTDGSPSSLMNVEDGNETSFGGADPLLIAWYNLNGTSDSSLYSMTLDESGGDPVRNTSGKIGAGYHFDGDDYIGASQTDQLDGMENLTVMAWVYVDTAGTGDHAVSMPADGTWGEGRVVWYRMIVSTTQFEVNVKDDTTNDCSFQDASFSPSLYTWALYGLTWDGSIGKFHVYKNGVNITSSSCTPFSIGAANLSLSIGSRSTADPGNYFKGIIDEVRVYNKTLSNDEMHAIYNNTIGTHNFTEFGAEEVNAVTAFILPTLENNSYTPNNYIEVNGSIAENATSCLLEWDDGTISNETMTIINADGNTSCWLNMTGLSDGEYLFIIYADMITSGHNSTGQRNITVDATAPSVNITSPIGMVTNTEVEINYTATDAGGNIDSCWYSYSGTNTTLASCANATLTITAAGSGTIIVYANDTLGNINSSTASFTMILFNLAVYNATENATMTDWHVYMVNGSDDSYSSFTNNNTLALNISDVPTGEIEMTAWKSGYGNNTYNFTSQGITSLSFIRHLILDTFFVNITPDNNSVYFTGEAFTINISLPNYADGNASIWYSLNGSSYTLGCAECNEYSRDVSFSFGQNNITALINDSTHYAGVDNENKTIIITIYTAKYNISFLDEMTNNSIDFSANKNGTLRVFCSDVTLADQPVTDTLHDFIVNCTGTLDYIWFKLYDPKGDHYRTLIPTFNTGNLSFYVINTTPDITVNKVTFSVTDASGLYQAGIMHFKKIILTEGQKDIIDTIIGSDGKVYAHLIGGETYTMSVESEDGENSKTLGEYTVPDTTATSQPLTIIDITFIPTTYNYIGTDISWSMQMNTSMERIYFYWNDSTGQTTSIKFWIYNITNVTARTQMYYDTVSGQSNHLFQWDYVTNGNENDTYLGYFEVDHAIHGNITESRPIAKDTILHPWLGDIGSGWYHMISIFLLVFVAAIFGAKHAPIGAVILSIMAALFFYIEWLPAIIGGSARLSSLLMISLIALSILAMFIIRRRRI